jgi:hypothetical protein
MRSMIRLAVAAAALLVAEGASAMQLQKPSDKVLLTVTGAIGETNEGDKAVFDRAMLEGLQQRTTKVETPWTKGLVSFEGPLGAALLDAVGAKGSVLHIVALNDYSVDVPVADFRKWPVILALKKDGAEMPVRDKGPIFVIYPFDVDKSLYNEVYFGRSAWQVKSIEIR